MTSSMPLRALSLTQPWASLVLLPSATNPLAGEKEYETRGWQTKVRGPVAIHAAKGFPRECRELVSKEPFRTVLARHGIHRAEHLPTGVILGVVDWMDCISTEQAVGIISAQEYAFGHYGPNRFAHRLANPRRLSRPRECRGALGFWTIPVAILPAFQELNR